MNDYAQLLKVDKLLATANLKIEIRGGEELHPVDLELNEWVEYCIDFPAQRFYFTAFNRIPDEGETSRLYYSIIFDNENEMVDVEFSEWFLHLNALIQDDDDEIMDAEFIDGAGI